MKKFQCAMDLKCEENISIIDSKGFIYCQKHGLQRKQYQRARKLKPQEIKKIMQGVTLEKYS